MARSDAIGTPATNADSPSPARAPAPGGRPEVVAGERHDVEGPSGAPQAGRRRTDRPGGSPRRARARRGRRRRRSRGRRRPAAAARRPVRAQLGEERGRRPRTMQSQSPARPRPAPSRPVAQSRGDDGSAADRPVHARVGLRPDEQLHRDRRRPAQARPPRRLRRRGVVGRPAGAARVRRGPRRPGAAAGAGPGRASPGRRAVLEGLHPRHGAGVPQADDRAARDVHAADLAGAHRRRQVLRAAAPRDHRPPATGRDRRGQRRVVPGAPDRGQAVRPDRVVQSAGDPGRRRPRDPAGLLRPAVRRPERVAGIPRGVRPDPPPDVGGLRRLVPRAGNGAVAGARVRATPRGT